MSELTYAVAQKILADTLAFCREKKFNPMAVVILDDKGGLKAAGSRTRAADESRDRHCKRRDAWRGYRVQPDEFELDLAH